MKFGARIFIRVHYLFQATNSLVRAKNDEDCEPLKELTIPKVNISAIKHDWYVDHHFLYLFPKEHATQPLNGREVIKNDAFVLKLRQTQVSYVYMCATEGSLFVSIKLDKSHAQTSGNTTCL